MSGRKQPNAQTIINQAQASISQDPSFAKNLAAKQQKLLRNQIFKSTDFNANSNKNRIL